MQVWNITHDIDNFIIINELNENKWDNTFLLDLTRQNYSLIEKIVYDITLFHAERLSIPIGTLFAEFWWKLEADTDCFHYDCDEYLKKTTGTYIHPLLSTITYFNDHDCPTVITQIDREIYKYKDFDKQNTITISFPRIGKHITFDSKYYHGISNVFAHSETCNKPRYILAINIWERQPECVDWYPINSKDNCDTSIVIEKHSEEIEQVYVTPEHLNFDLFERLTYKHENNLFTVFEEYIKDKSGSTFQFIRDDDIDKRILENSLKTKYGDIIDDINALLKKAEPIKYNRFLQRFQYSGIYTPDTCRWIISECEKYALQNGGWTTRRHVSYPTTDLPVELIGSVFGFILETFKTITSKIMKSYCLDENTIKLDYTDVFIVKYEYSAQEYLEMHCDGSFISFQILLSNITDFEGGGTYFDDGLIMKPDQGGLVIHSSHIKHSGLPITSGIRYVLVGFVNLVLENTPIE